MLAGKFKDKFVEGRDIWSFTINFEEIFYFGNKNFRVYAAFDVSQTPIYYGYQFYNMQVAARNHGWTPFSAMENHYNLLYREDERELIPICKQMNVSLMPYSPLAAGHLARPQWKSDSLRGTTDRVAMGKYDKTETEDMKIVKRVAELAEKYDCKMSQIAIAWQWAKGIVSPIIGATKTSYLDDAAGAFNIKLTAEDIAYLEEPYVPHKIIGAIDKNPKQGVVLLDEKK